MSKPMDRGRQIIPPEELRCVWMTAGILSYQLCERRFDCDRCPLDAAMRMHFSRGAAAREAPGAPAAGSGRLESDRRYSRGHCWVQELPRDDGGAVRVRVGLEPGLATALLAPREVVRPKPGEPLRRGQAHAWIVTAGGTLPLPAPVSGTLSAANPELHDRPHTLLSQPFEEGWLYEMTLDDAEAELAGLMDADRAEEAYAADANRFREELARALQSEGGAAAALPDGGAVLQDVSAMVGPTKYFALLCKVFG